MLPISQALAARYQPIDAEGLQAVSSITPVEAATAESPLWQRLRPGLQLSATLIQKETSGQAPSPNPLALFKVAISLPASTNPALAAQTQQVWMQLPANLPAGQRLQLQVLRGQSGQGGPEVKWSALPSTLSASLSASLTTAHSTAPGLLAYSEAIDVNLSTPAKQLQQWLSSSPMTQQAAPLIARSVVSHHPEKPQMLAQELKHALDNSGLFYESHLKEATLGTRPWHQLLQEPQNQPNFQAPQTVAQQLHVLEQQRLTWQGEIWPGQTMTWQVSERQSATPSSHEAVADNLFSHLRLTMPHLGEVTARLTMVDGRLSIRLEAVASESQLLLKAGRPQLMQQLQTAGLAVTGIQITQGVVDGEPSTG